MFNLYLAAPLVYQPSDVKDLGLHIPFVVDGLDDEPQRGADSVHIFAHNLLNNRRLARVVETAVEMSA